MEIAANTLLLLTAIFGFISVSTWKKQHVDKIKIGILSQSCLEIDNAIEYFKTYTKRIRTREVITSYDEATNYSATDLKRDDDKAYEDWLVIHSKISQLKSSCLLYELNIMHEFLIQTDDFLSEAKHFNRQRIINTFNKDIQSNLDLEKPSLVNFDTDRPHHQALQKFLHDNESGIELFGIALDKLLIKTMSLMRYASKWLATKS